MSEDMIPLGINDPMEFGCGAENPCFNECCRDLNQALTPYDILRMKKALKISSHSFLREYTSMHIGPETGLPVVEFKPNPATGHACPFVTEKGCSVYEDRPGSCRLYPLARAIARDRATGEIREYFALIKEDHCKGFGKKEGRTVGKWLEGQHVGDHNRQNDKLMELISLKNQIMPGRLEGAESDIFYLALYNLDEFRDKIQNQGLLKDLVLPRDFAEKIAADDTALLDFGIAWVKHRLFGRELRF
ncbi:YkgJ family cysteine cluster protein [Desulfospira joergensenii]|uniref:YkgJ family cysteine cluster protein n=1 Tax=Desulfospira joergensenii TaxID=53329 RepID=UPI0003B5217E|nr:YkgJ family cysteine cluster protein [Desulfospira joergensenii]